MLTVRRWFIALPHPTVPVKTYPLRNALRRKILGLLLCLAGFTALPAIAGLSASPNPSTTGSYTVSWDAFTGINFSRFRLSESSDGGASWVDVYSGSSLSKAFTAQPSGVYRYQKYLCTILWIFGQGTEMCVPEGTWVNGTYVITEVVETVVGLSPPTGLTAPTLDVDGTYDVTWLSVTNATSYQLQEQTGGGTWVTVYSGSGLATNLSGRTNNTYHYRVAACSGGCSAYSGTVTTTVTLLANVTAPITVLPTSAVGALPFSSQVSDLGDAQVTVPLQLPAGVNGLAPALSLEYASGGGRAAMDAEQVQGVLGYGWRLRGISEIRRCRIGIGGAIALNTTDRLCLDNQPLVRINTGSYWADGGEYRTEKQSFIQLVSQGVGIANWSFDVHLPNGHVRTYGNTTASRITPPNNTTPYLWTLTTETDDFNNVLSVTWIKNSAAGLNFPQRISYGSAVVDFYYEERTDTSGQLSNMVPGVLYRAVALNRIFVRMNGVSVRDYRLEQTTITDTQSNPPKDYRLLNQVQLCGYDASGSSASCLQPVSFAWMTPVGTPTAFGQVVNGITASTGETTTFLYYTLPGSGSGNHTLHRDPITWFGTYVAPSTVATISDARVVVQEYNPPDGIGGHQQFKYYYTGYPLYNTQGRGFVGFPSTQVDQYKIPTFDRATSTSIDQREITYLQHRLTFPFIGKISRVYQQIYAEGSWKNTLRRMIGWGSKTFFSGTVTFPFVERSYDRPLVVNATNGQNSLSATESVRSYCFRTLDGNGNCPTSGTEGETPTQLMRVNKTGISLSTQTFSGEWGNVLARTVNSVTHYADQSADFTNTVTGSNWAIGFVNQLTSHQGVTAPTLTQTAQFTPNASHSLAVATVHRFPGDGQYDLTETRSYDLSGHLTQSATSGIGVSSRTTSASGFAQAANLFATRLTNALNQSVTLAYDLRFGTPSSVTDPNGNLTSITRDAFGRITQQTAPDGTTTDMLYEDCAAVDCSMVTWAPADQRVTRTITNGATQVSPSVHLYLDTLGRSVLKETQAFNPGNGWSRVETHYDAVGRIHQTSLPTFSVGGTPVYLTQHYDYKDRVVYTQRPDGSTLATTFVGSYGVLTATTTDSASGHQKKSTFNPLNQLTQTIDGYTSSDAVTTDYTYTPQGKLDVVTVDGSQVANMDYDVAGFRSQIIEPNSGTSLFTYDALGELTQSTDAKAQKTQFSYDLLGRVTQRIDGWLGSNAETNTFTWDSAANGIGLLASRAKPGFSESFTYDLTSRLSSTQTSISVAGFTPSGTYTTSLTYNAAGQLSQTSYPNLAVDYVYTAQGTLSQVKKGATVLEDIQTRDAFGHTTQETYGNGLQTLKAFDALSGRLTSIETGSLATPKAIQDLETQWRADGALLKRTDKRGTTTTGDDRIESFGYDALNRVTSLSATLPGVTSRNKAYAFDRKGNLTSKTSNLTNDLSVTGYTYGISGQPQRLSSASIQGISTTFSYDANGNITQYNATSGDDTFIDYDASNRATKITVGTSSSTNTPTGRDEFYYDPDGNRFLRKATWQEGATQKVSWELSLYGGTFEESHPEWDATITYRQRIQVTSSVLHRFIKWPGSSMTSIEYTHRDHLGSVDAITTATGSLLRNLSFDPYGSRRESDWSKDATSTTLAQIQGDQDIYGSRGFTGHEHLDHTGIIHMNGRIFDPRLGRFLQPDPIVQNPSFSQSYNRYAYVLNSPLSFTDPSGFDGLDGGALSSFFTFFSPSLFVVSGKPVSSDFVSSDDGPGRSNLSGNTTQSPTDPMNSDTVSTVAERLPVGGGVPSVAKADQSIQQSVTEASNAAFNNEVSLPIKPVEDRINDLYFEERVVSVTEVGGVEVKGNGNDITVDISNVKVVTKFRQVNRCCVVDHVDFREDLRLPLETLRSEVDKSGVASFKATLSSMRFRFRNRTNLPNCGRISSCERGPIREETRPLLPDNLDKLIDFLR